MALSVPAGVSTACVSAALGACCGSGITYALTKKRHPDVDGSDKSSLGDLPILSHKYQPFDPLPILSHKISEENDELSRCDSFDNQGALSRDHSTPGILSRDHSKEHLDDDHLSRHVSADSVTLSKSKKNATPRVLRVAMTRSFDVGDRFQSRRRVGNNSCAPQLETSARFMMATSLEEQQQVIPRSQSQSSVSSNEDVETMSVVSHEFEQNFSDLQGLTPTKVPTEELLRKLPQYVQYAVLDESTAAAAKDRRLFCTTLTRCIDLLSRGAGGIIIAVIHEDCLDRKFQCRYLDGGIHTGVLRSVARNIHENKDEFDTVLEALTAHTEADRWSPDELNALSLKIPDVQAHIARLVNQPKDGALVLSHTGTVKAAALHIGYASERFSLVKRDGTRAGTRHAASLAFAEWLGKGMPEGASMVFVRSDAGDGHAFFPRVTQPDMYEFETLHIHSQTEMLNLFKDRIVKHGYLMRKIHPVMIREARQGEEVVTLLDGRVTGQKIIQDNESMVIRSPGIEQEQYVLHKDRVSHHYMLPAIDLETLENSSLLKNKYFVQTQAKALKDFGFKLYVPQPDELRWLYKFTHKDMEEVPAKRFGPIYGAYQGLAEGTLVAMPAPIEKATALYKISKHQAETFVKDEDMHMHSELVSELKKLMRLSSK